MIEHLVDHEAELLERVADVEGERAAYRELLTLALEALHRLTQQKHNAPCDEPRQAA